jgi:acyl-CoA synthetase (AMP-forming)/AMP-acid ligase II
MTGDAMARPLIEEYERQAATGTPYDASSLFLISSSAAIFSPDVKKRWIAVFPDAIFTDSVGATETGFHGMGMQDRSAISSDGPVVGIGPGTVVLDDDGNVLDPATDVGRTGRLARGGNVPVGYYKDPEKSARTFLEIGGRRYSVPGDMARIEEGNRITLLGRGSNCVNTGGEKVYPEEVELALRSHDDVFDCVVVGVPDDRWGEMIVALVQAKAGHRIDADALREFCRATLAAYKVPKQIVVVESLERSPAGKADYKRLRELAAAEVAL